jgi:hypothetical protein
MGVLITVLIALVISAATTALFLFLLSPVLMGDNAPPSARAIIKELRDFILGHSRRSPAILGMTTSAAFAVFIINPPQFVAGRWTTFDTTISSVTSGNVTSQPVVTL